MQFSLNKFAFTGWRWALAAVVVVGGGYFYFSGSSSTGTALTIVPGDFPTQVAVSGTVIAAQDVQLGFAASGRVSGVFASVGQHVGAGALLAQEENGDLQAAVEEQKANLASLQAGTRPEQVAVAQAAVQGDQTALVTAIQSAYTAADDAVHNKSDALFSNPRVNPMLSFTTGNAQLKSQTEAARAAIEPVLVSWASSLATVSAGTAANAATDATSRLAQVIAYLAQANATLNQAIPDQTTSAATLTTYGTNLSAGRTEVNSAATALATAIAALTDAQKSLALDQAGATAPAIQAAQAAVQNAQAALAKTEVYAPFSGIVTQMDAKVGEIISPSASQISMQSDGVFQIEVYIPEVAISGVAVGDLASTTLDAYGSTKNFPAKVISVDPAETVKDGVPTYKTTLVFLAADGRIRSGMTANVTIITGTLRDAIVIPSGAVGSKNGTSYVSVIEGKRVVARTVTTGTSPSLGQIQITSGLSAGDVIALTPSP